MSSLGPPERSRQKSLPPFRSDLGPAAVNEQFDTRDETGVIGSQKQRHLSNFFGFPMRPIGMLDPIRAITSTNSTLPRGRLIGTGLTTFDHYRPSLTTSS